MVSIGTATSATADESQLQQIYASGLQGGSGGSYGYLVKEVGGPVVLQRNEGLAYDPASALKTLILTYAMRQVAAGADALTNPVTVYRYPSSRNAGTNPSSPNLCPNPADEHPGNAQSMSLQDVLRAMMVPSDNRATRALELRYGRGNLNALASSLGMASTWQGQVFGCGWDNGLRNSWTLGDAAKLYEGIAAGTAIPATSREALYGSMIVNRSPSGVSSVVQQEADALGIGDAASEFASAMTMWQKGGSYDICITSCEVDVHVIRNQAGVLRLPFQNSSGTVAKDYVFGSFIADKRVLCPGGRFPCAAAEQAGTAVNAAIPEMFRSVIRSALQTWTAVTALSAAKATYTAGRLRVSAQLSTKYGGKPVSGQSIRFSVGGRALCSASTNASGEASCSGTFKNGATQYEARFAGSNGLFASTANAAVAVRKVRITVKKNGNGVVTSVPAGITCGTRCSAAFAVNSVVKLVAKPPKGFGVKWGGACKGTKLTCTLRSARATEAIVVWTN